MLLLTIDLGGVDLARDQGQNYGLQAALALELEELLIHQEVPAVAVMLMPMPVAVVVMPMPMPAVQSLDSSSHSPAGRSPRLSGGREGCDEPVAEGEVGIPLGQSSPLTLAAFFSESENPSRLKAFAVDFGDLGEEKVLKQVLESEGSGLLRQTQGGQEGDQAYQGGRMGRADRWTGLSRS